MEQSQASRIDLDEHCPLLLADKSALELLPRNSLQFLSYHYLGVAVSCSLEALKLDVEEKGVVQWNVDFDWKVSALFDHRSYLILEELAPLSDQAIAHA